MNSKDTSDTKLLNRMTKAELLKEIKRLGKEKTDLKQYTSELQDSAELLKLEAERDEWMEKAMHQEEELTKQEALKKEFEEKVKKERKYKDKQLSKLEQKNQELNTKLTGEGKGVQHALDSLHKSSFRLDFYRQEEGEVYGKIEHLISRKKETLTGFDEEKLLGFVKKHIMHFLYNEGESKEENTSKASIRTNSKKKGTEITTGVVPKEKYPEIGSLKINGIHKNTPSQVISRKESALVSMSFDSFEMDNTAVYQWEAQLFSKPMQNLEKSVLIGNYKGNGLKGTDIVVEVLADYLPLGPNRLNANLDLFKIENQRRIQLGSYSMSGLAYVQ